MPKYELMYIVASSVSDDQIPTLIDGVLNLIKSQGGSIIKEENLGKKKLAYPIKKTRNGFYDLVTFEMEPSKLNELNNKILTSDGIIRHLIINIEDTLKRIQKDAVAQEKMNKNRAEKNAIAENTRVHEEPKEVKTEGAPITAEDLDQKIEEALSEDLSNV